MFDVGSTDNAYHAASMPQMMVICRAKTCPPFLHPRYSSALRIGDPFEAPILTSQGSHSSLPRALPVILGILDSFARAAALRTRLGEYFLRFGRWNECGSARDVGPR